MTFQCDTINRFLTFNYFEIEQEDDEYVDEVTGEILKGLRRYGPSKQHQPSPLVQMGLFMDGNGIPISMCINPGSDNEQKCALPLEKKNLKMFQGKPFIYCADAGLGSYDIRKFNSMGGRAFIVAQSVKKLSDTLQKAVFNDYDYRRLSNNSLTTVNEMKSFDRFQQDNLPLYDDSVYKVLTADKAVDTGLIDNEEKYDGYYAIATNLNDDVKTILEINSQRYKIEDCFRVLKTNFNSRPVHHRNRNRIIAHFMICYTALLIYRLLENKLNQYGTHFTTDNILDTLKNMNVMNTQDTFYTAAYIRSQVCTSLNGVFDLGLDKKYYLPKELNKKIKKIL